jgi:hypothetical protein
MHIHQPIEGHSDAGGDAAMRAHGISAFVIHVVMRKMIDESL